MLDGFARSITYLRISITDRCNYRCRYCMPDGGIEKCAHEDICSLEELRDMAAAAVRCGVKKIRVTGGEPLVRRGAVDFCRMLSEIPGVEELCVTTNGSLLKEFARPLRDAGVTHLNISLDTLNEERFRAITALARCRIPWTVSRRRSARALQRSSSTACCSAASTTTRLPILSL